MEYGKVPSGWEVIEGDFALFLAMNTPYLSTDTCIAPHADPSDGLIDLVYVRKSTTTKLLSLFLKDLESGQAVAGSPEVEYRRVRAFHLEPLEEKGVIMVDGEKHPVTPMKVEALPSVLSLMCPKELAFPLIPFAGDKSKSQ